MSPDEQKQLSELGATARALATELSEKLLELTAQYNSLPLKRELHFNLYYKPTPSSANKELSFSFERVAATGWEFFYHSTTGEPVYLRDAPLEVKAAFWLNRDRVALLHLRGLSDTEALLRSALR